MISKDEYGQISFKRDFENGSVGRNGRSSVVGCCCCDRSKCGKCFKAFVAFLFSRVGLSIVVVGYIVMGGWMFQALELQNEVNVKVEMTAILDKTIHQLWKEILRKQESRSSDVNFTRAATRILTDYEEKLIRNIKSGYNGFDDSDDVEWSFFGAVLYATTLISTIGYGHVTCKTAAGKTITVIYCIVGIPLMMLFSANIGSSMAASFRFLIKKSLVSFKRNRNNDDKQHNGAKKTHDTHSNASKCERIPRLDRQLRTEMENDALRRIDELIMRQCDQATDSADTPITDSDMSNKCISVTDADGSGSKVPFNCSATRTFEVRLDNLIQQWSLSSISAGRFGGYSTGQRPFSRLGEANLSNSGYGYGEGGGTGGDDYGLRREYYPSKSLQTTIMKNAKRSSRSSAVVHVSKTSSPPDMVPLPMATILFFSYVLLGAALFAAWEDDWSFLNSFYFCFVTLTTIGFGDFVPGKTINARTSPTKFIIATCYIIFGLVLIGMCISLVKERFRYYIKSFASKISITKR